MPAKGLYPRLPMYTSRTLFRYHPYPRVRRRYDQLNRSIVCPVYEDNVGEPLLDLPPSISLRPLGVVGTTSNDDVSNLDLDDCTCPAEESEAARTPVQVSSKWFTKVILVVWRSYRAVRAMRSRLPPKVV